MKKTRRHQRGYVFRKGSVWYLRYYDRVLMPDGTVADKQKCRRLAAAVGDYRSKRAAEKLADEFLRPLNDGTFTPESTMTVRRYVEEIYLPYVAEQKRKSTHSGYQDLWNRYLKERTEIPLREFRAFEGEQVLMDVVKEHDLSRTTMAHIKSFLSGAFRHARRGGILQSENPMRDVVIPKAKPGGETHAYSLEDIDSMLKALPEAAAAVVATAAFTGARRGEVRGMLWENYDGQQIRITQSVWRSHTDEPKTTRSKAPVPVIAPLRERLDRYRVTLGFPDNGLIFQSSTGTPLDLAQYARKVIRPALQGAKVTWHGWHAFRRGLATNLYRLGVPAKTIQAILRHTNVSTTLNAYIQSVPEDVTAAMRELETALCNQHATAAERSGNYVM